MQPIETELKLISYNTPPNQHEIILIRIDPSFVYFKYLYLFSNDIQEHINSYINYRDKLVAFTSAMLKYYYLPTILGINPAETQIEIDSYGKPHLLNYPAIDFSVSHSGEYVVLAVAFGGNIGIDIEFIDKHIDLTIKSIVFSDFECKLINNYYDFFVLWSKKEAYLKCLGFGFSNEIHRHTTLNNQLLESFNQYKLNTLILGGNYVLSVCVTNIL